MRRTITGMDPLICVSLLQKSLRRADLRHAAWAFNELDRSGYHRWAWRRLLITAAEDCAGLIHGELQALHAQDTHERKSRRKGSTRVFWAKALVMVARSWKSRDADHLTNLVVDRIADDDPDLADAIDGVERDLDGGELPDWTFDVHTDRGRRMGRTRADFFESEHAALSPRFPGLFDDLID